MDANAVEHATIAIQDLDSRDPELESEIHFPDDADSPDGDGMRELGSAGEVLTKVELDLVYCTEKLVNLHVLLMHVAARESDFEAITVQSDDVSADSIEKAMEFNLLSGVLDSEVRELDNFIKCLERDFVDACQKISSCEHLLDSFPEMEEKLLDSEESLKQLKDQASELEMQSAKFQRTLLANSWLENGDDEKGVEFSETNQFPDVSAKLKMQTAEQQRHILRMLEKSLARELDLEKKVSESRQNEEDLKLKLHSMEQEVFCLEEAEEIVWERLFEAESTAEILMGISKEMMGRLQIVQFNLNGAIKRENEMNIKLTDSMGQVSAKENAFQKLEANNTDQKASLKANLKEAMDKCSLAESEIFTLREKVNSLEQQLKESEIKLQDATTSLDASMEHNRVFHSEMCELENVIDNLKKNVSEAESKAEVAEAKCVLLTETNLELNQELGLLKSTGSDTEKINFLEEQLREADIELQHAKASAEASQEQQNLYYSAIEDMENLIADLKLKVSKAESRAETAESKCILLSETNIELNEELSFLRSRMDSLESSLRKADNVKVATAKDISIRTKVISDLVMQLTRERKRVQKQMSSLICENKNLVKLLRTRGASVVMINQGNENNTEHPVSKDDLVTKISTEVPQEAVMESSNANFQVDESLKGEPVGATEVEPTISTNDATGEDSEYETVRTIEAGELIKSKQLLCALLALIASVVVVYLFQQEGLWSS